MRYKFDQLIDRKNTHSLKWDQDALLHSTSPDLRRDPETIRWMMEDMDFACAPEITAALHRTADFPTFGYTSADARPEWKQAVIRWYERRYDLSLRPEWILYSAGAMSSIEQAVQAYTSPGDGVIICRPVYNHFGEIIERMGRQTVNCQLKDEGSHYYLMDWERFEQVCAVPENRLFLLCSPADPVGRVWRKAELVKMIEICRRNHVIVLADEMHAGILRKDQKHTPLLAAAPEDLSNLIMVGGADKAFNLMGLNCAYTVIPDRDLRRTFTFGYHPPLSPFSLAALTAAYDAGEDWLSELNTCLDENLDYAVNFLREQMPKVRVWMPEGTYNLWLDFSLYDCEPADLKRIINGVANIAMRCGQGFDPQHGRGFVRLCLVSPRSVVQEGMQRLAAAFAAFERERNAVCRDGAVGEAQGQGKAEEPDAADAAAAKPDSEGC